MATIKITGKKISELGERESITGDELIPCEINGENQSIKAKKIMASGLPDGVHFGPNVEIGTGVQIEGSGQASSVSIRATSDGGVYIRGPLSIGTGGIETAAVRIGIGTGTPASELKEADTIIYRGVKIGANTDIGHDVTISEDTRIWGNTYIGTDARIEGNATINSKVTIGSSVNIGESVHIGNYANIGTDVKIGIIGVASVSDEAVFIAPGVAIGHYQTNPFDLTASPNVLIGSQVNIEHHVSIDEHVAIGSQVYIGGHVHIGESANVADMVYIASVEGMSPDEIRQRSTVIGTNVIIGTARDTLGIDDMQGKTVITDLVFIGLNTAPAPEAGIGVHICNDVLIGSGVHITAEEGGLRISNDYRNKSVLLPWDN